MSRKTDSGSATGFYERTIGPAHDRSEAYGYVVFVAGLLLGVLGIAAFLPSEAGGTLRQWSIVAAAIGLALLVAGPVIRLPLEPAATYAAYLGVALCAAATVWFVVLFPADWSPTDGNPGVIALYALGLAIVGLGGVVVPLVTDTATADPTPPEEPAESTHERDTARADELEATVADLEAEVDELATERDALRAELDDHRDSQAQFELYEDRGGEYRWRLRHRNGNVIATGGEGYTRKHNAQKGLQSVRRNALGAALLQVEREADEAEPADAPLLTETADESQATFEVYEDNAGEHRWRLVHENGNIVAVSGEGFSSRSNTERAIESVRRNAPPAEYLQFDPASVELYEDAGGEWRWRLVHRNGNILADSGEGYTRRRDARRAVEAVQERVTDDEFEVYEDNAGEYRWRLRAENGEIVADSGEGYASRSNAEDAVERVREYLPDADALDMGYAAFEVYEDAGGEWRWRLRHRNGNILANPGEGYNSRTAAQDAVDSVKRNAPGADLAGE